MRAIPGAALRTDEHASYASFERHRDIAGSIRSVKLSGVTGHPNGECGHRGRGEVGTEGSDACYALLQAEAGARSRHGATATE